MIWQSSGVRNTVHQQKFLQADGIFAKILDLAQVSHFSTMKCGLEWNGKIEQ